MNNIIKTDDNQIIGFFHSSNGLEISKPFERDIFLLETHIAGTSYVKNFSNIEPVLQIDDRLDFFREPDNKVDKHAVLIYDRGGHKLGYLPSHDNLIISRLMDAGKLIYGRIAYKKKRGDWNHIMIKVFMED